MNATEERWDTGLLIEVLVICVLAKMRHYKLKYLFYSWTFYPILIVQCTLAFFQGSIFFRIYYFIRFVPLVEPAIILSFLFALFVYRLYRPAIIGAGCITFGTLLNKFVIAQNGGKMPVFPSFSYLTGYVTPGMFSSMDSLHILGGVETKFKFLTDYIDYGYSILSPGDILIHLFVCIMLFSLIKAVNHRYSMRA